MRVKEVIVESLLSALVQQDQSERQQYQTFVKTQAGGDWNKGAQMYARAKRRPANDIFGERARLNKFIQTKFDFATFTPEDWNNYWTLAQHCDFDRNFQKQALAAIEQNLGQDSEQYKYLYDRISCGLTGKQKFGTQDVCQLDK